MQNIWRFPSFGIVLSTLLLASTAHSCCPCTNVDPSPCQESIKLSDDDLFGHGGSFPVVAALRDKHRDSVTVQVQDPFSDQVQEIIIPNGSLLGFTDPGVIGRVIQACSTDAQRGFSHVGLAITGVPSEMANIVRASIVEGGLSSRKKKYHIAQLEALTTAYPYLKIYLRAAAHNKLESPKILELLKSEKNDVFCFESTGSPSEVLRGIAPRVRLTPLSTIVANYHGDLCVRPLNEGITLRDLQPVLAKELGVSYEKKVSQLVGSTKNRNRKEDSTSWFCSELVAHIYKMFHRINDPLILANNVTPNQFQSWFEGDLLRGKAGPEFYLREYNKTLDGFKEQIVALENRVQSFKNGKCSPFRVLSLPNVYSAEGDELSDADSVASSGTPEPSEVSVSSHSSSDHA